MNGLPWLVNFCLVIAKFFTGFRAKLILQGCNVGSIDGLISTLASYVTFKEHFKCAKLLIWPFDFHWLI